MIDRQMRAASAVVLGPLAAGPLRNVPPVALSVGGAGIGVLAAGAASRSYFVLALVLWLVNRVVDGLDGLVARAASRTSDAGGYLDMTLDVVVYALVPLGVAAGIDHERRWLAASVLLASFYFNTITWAYLSSILEKRGRGAMESGESTTITMPAGLVEGAETVVLFAFMLLVPSMAVPTMFAMATLVTVGAAIRFWSGWRRLSLAPVGPAKQRPTPDPGGRRDAPDPAGTTGQ